MILTESNVHVFRKFYQIEGYSLKFIKKISANVKGKKNSQFNASLLCIDIILKFDNNTRKTLHFFKIYYIYF